MTAEMPGARARRIRGRARDALTMYLSENIFCVSTKRPIDVPKGLYSCSGYVLRIMPLFEKKTRRS